LNVCDQPSGLVAPVYVRKIKLRVRFVHLLSQTVAKPKPDVVETSKMALQTHIYSRICLLEVAIVLRSMFWITIPKILQNLTT
jgi:hypothetical protein